MFVVHPKTKTISGKSLVTQNDPSLVLAKSEVRKYGFMAEGKPITTDTLELSLLCMSAIIK